MRHSVKFGGIGRVVAAGVFSLGVALVPGLASAQGNQGQPNQGQGQGGESPGGTGTPSQGNQGNQGNQGSQEQQQQQQSSDVSQTTNATLKVAKVDGAARIITFEDPRGGTFDVKAGPDINLSKVRVGQMMDVTYYQEVAVAVSKQGQAAPMTRTTTANRGGVTAKQTTITAQIVSVDHENNTVRVKGPNGQMHTIVVSDPTLQQKLNTIQPGDNVTISYTQAVAVAAMPHQS